VAENLNIAMTKMSLCALWFRKLDQWVSHERHRQKAAHTHSGVAYWDKTLRDKTKRVRFITMSAYFSRPKLTKTQPVSCKIYKRSIRPTGILIITQQV